MTFAPGLAPSGPGIGIVNVESPLTSGATVAFDGSQGSLYSLLLTGNCALAAPINMVKGLSYQMIFTQDGTGSRLLTFGAHWFFAGGTAPTLSTAAGAVDIATFTSDGTNMYMTSFNQAYAA